MSPTNRTRTLLMALACVWCVQCVSAQAHSGKTFMMHYMPWFISPDFRGFWGPHWTSFDNPPLHDPDTFVGPDNRRDIWSNYYPLIEPYDSADPDVIECQLLQMKLAGVDGVFIDWYGLSATFDYPDIHTATLALVQQVDQMGMLFGIVYEDREIGARLNNGELTTFNSVINAMSSTFQWMDANWFNKNYYIKRNGRPFLLNFGPISVNDNTNPQQGEVHPETALVQWQAALNTLASDPLFFPLHNNWSPSYADGGFNWVHWSAYDDTPVANPSDAQVRAELTSIFNATGAADQVIPSAFAMFDDVYVPGGAFPYLDPQGGRTLRLAIEAAVAGPWDIVQLGTWNDYTEGTMIEPTREFGYTFLEVIQDERRQELGSSFTFTHDDLRMPAELLALRREGLVPSAELDAIAQLLSNGDTQSARNALDLIQGGPILAQPASAIANAGGVLVLSAEVQDNGSGMTLRWQRDGVPLSNGAKVSGATTPTLTIANVDSSDVGVYTLSVTGNNVTTLSDPAIGGVRYSGVPGDLNNDALADQADIDLLLQRLGD